MLAMHFHPPENVQVAWLQKAQKRLVRGRKKWHPWMIKALKSNFTQSNNVIKRASIGNKETIRTEAIVTRAVDRVPCYIH